MTERDGRVVITGLGIISPIGIGAEAVTASLLEGRSGVAPLKSYQGSALPNQLAAEVIDFNDESAKKVYLKDQRKWIKVMCREIQLGSAVATLALKDAGIDTDNFPHERLGVEFGANLMCFAPDAFSDPMRVCVDEKGDFVFSKWGGQGKDKLEPLWLLKYLPNMPACHIAINADARGPSNSLTLDEASGNVTMLEALSVIRRGAADAMVVGTTGNRLTPTKTIQARLWEELARGEDDPRHPCKPFDSKRSGQVIGEGAASVIVEGEAKARERGAKILARVLGGGASCVADKDGVGDVRKAVGNAIRNALHSTGLQPDQIGHISAHGTGTRAGDLAEAAGIKDAFGATGSRIPVTGFKGAVGNSGAACGSIELVAGLLGTARGVVWPTIGTTAPDPECGLNVITGKPLPIDNKTFLKISYTNCGQASAIVVQGL